MTISIAFGFGRLSGFRTSPSRTFSNETKRTVTSAVLLESCPEAHVLRGRGDNSLAGTVPTLVTRFSISILKDSMTQQSVCLCIKRGEPAIPCSECDSLLAGLMT